MLTNLGMYVTHAYLHVSYDTTLLLLLLLLL